MPVRAGQLPLAHEAYTPLRLPPPAPRSVVCRLGHHTWCRAQDGAEEPGHGAVPNLHSLLAADFVAVWMRVPQMTPGSCSSRISRTTAQGHDRGHP